MAEPTTQRMRMTFTVKRADNGRLFIACDPLGSEPEPVIPGSHATESDPAIPAPDPTETEAIIRGSESDPTLISGLFTFELKEGVTEEQATQLAERMTTRLSHLMFTPLWEAFPETRLRGPELRPERSYRARSTAHVA